MVETRGQKHNTSTDPKITRDLERKGKQVLVDTHNRDTTNQSMDELKSKFNKIITEHDDPEKPIADTEVQQVIKLRNGGLILQFKTKEAAEWFRQPQVGLTLLPKVDKDASVKDRSYQILVPRVPIVFNLEDEEHLREAEEGNNINTRVLHKAKWIKPVY
jgi:hypothetical protein